MKVDLAPTLFLVASNPAEGATVASARALPLGPTLAAVELEQAVAHLYLIRFSLAASTDR